ncbi:PREDICTED: uncharacterized protein LOC104806101 [Tarenaya hassleriana]|uniref:uncharacterized protein LOC104806101 n=1 Tax=Tarenaya hassleriana TaxID=28532 RepID=UPI00053CA52C|nr:PREDICTED: uncharacterized protein LOC104806101 [Tarenaya hassleriana]
MGKSIPTKTGVRAAAEASLKLVKSSKSIRPVSSNLRSASVKMAESTSGEAAVATAADIGSSRRFPLSAVVADCAKRWFKDTLQEAKAGDTGMQVLVGQMYYTGYGVPRDARKGRLWITKASKIRSSVWSVKDKHPGYNASDSDSD